MLLCGVFDGHGPHGHEVAHHVRDNLPMKLSRAIELSKLNSFKYGDVDVADKDLFDDNGEADHDHGNSITNTDHDHDNVNKDDNQNDQSLRVLSLSSWEACLIKSFTEMDEELSLDSSIDSFCSGSTAVAVVKQVPFKFNSLLRSTTNDKLKSVTTANKKVSVIRKTRK